MAESASSPGGCFVANDTKVDYKGEMKPTRKNGRELFFIALAAIALGVFNLAIKRFIDGSLCLIAGVSLLLVWQIKRNK